MNKTQHDEQEQRIRRQLWEVFGYIPPDARPPAPAPADTDDNTPQPQEVTDR